MKNLKLLFLVGGACIIPWGFILEFAGIPWQIIGIFIQLFGLATMVIKRKIIF